MTFTHTHWYLASIYHRINTLTHSKKSFSLTVKWMKKLQLLLHWYMKKKKNKNKMVFKFVNIIRLGQETEWLRPQRLIYGCRWCLQENWCKSVGNFFCVSGIKNVGQTPFSHLNSNMFQYLWIWQRTFNYKNTTLSRWYGQTTDNIG